MLLSVKLKNQIIAAMYNTYAQLPLEYHLRNISINGEKRGCSGFVLNPLNGKIAYVNTEGIQWHGQAHKCLYRTAQSLTDYTGGYNQYAEDNRLGEAVLNLLK